MSELNVAGIGMTSQRTRDRLLQRLRDSGISNEAVLSVMGNLPRHLFVDEALAHRAYEDTALPIGFSQTISQPHTVALMTQILLDVPQKPYSVLEVGTGCGYQTAVLSALFPQVYTIERIGGLHKQAKQRLKQLEIYNVEFRHTDGTGGWPNKHYRFDCILMAAACSQMPSKIFEQLKIGGVMVFPYDTGKGQRLIKAIQTNAGIKTYDVSAVSFVPLLDGVQ
ncbi:MAG: protein-L-isoaspartate(D-aspartate) O-methyltransferase [Gammaproteobacteria bacterium]|nr:protein-L-isoaspartate(D-aspartate) O-methyltransferase [Gammaproteobacteria bacterium]